MRVVILLALILPGTLFCQVKVDSLMKALETQGPDTNRINTLNVLAYELRIKNGAKCTTYAKEAMELSKKLKYSRGIIESHLNLGQGYLTLIDNQAALDNFNAAVKLSEERKDSSRLAKGFHGIGTVYLNKSNYPEAIDYFTSALEIRLKLGEKQLASASYNNIGVCYDYLGRYPDAIKNHFKSLTLKNEIGDKKGVAGSYHNIGQLYDKQGNYEDALKYNNEALKIRQELKDKAGLSQTYNNIGSLNFHLKNYKKALENYELALVIKQELGDLKGIASTMENVALMQWQLGNEEEALKLQMKVLDIRQSIDDPYGMVGSYQSLGTIYRVKNDRTRARQYHEKSLALALKFGIIERIKDVYEELARLDSSEGNFTSALRNYKLFVIYRDSLLNEENTKKTIQTRMQFDFDQKTASIKAEQEKKDALLRQDKQKKQVILYAVSAGLALVAGFAVLVLISLRQKQKASREIGRQKQIIEEKQREIVDSILYARRIQFSLLPPEKYIERNLNRLMKKN